MIYSSTNVIKKKRTCKLVQDCLLLDSAALQKRRLNQTGMGRENPQGTILTPPTQDLRNSGEC